MDENTALGRAIKHHFNDNQAELARHLDVSPSLVNQWIKGARPVPSDKMAAIERATGGAVRVEDFGVQTAWVRVPDKDWPHPKGRPLIDVAAKAPIEQGA